MIDIQAIYGDAPKKGSFNRKVRNATKVYNASGEKVADSKLEYRVMMALRNRGVDFEYQEKFVLLHTLKREGKITLKQCSWSPDFVFSDICVVADAKGFVTDRGKIMMRLFAHFYPEWDVIVVRNNADIDKLEELVKKRRENLR